MASFLRIQNLRRELFHWVGATIQRATQAKPRFSAESSVIMAPMPITYQEPLIWLISYFGCWFFNTLAIAVSARFLSSFLGIHPPHCCADFWLALKFISHATIRGFHPKYKYAYALFLLERSSVDSHFLKSRVVFSHLIWPIRAFLGHLCPSF